MWVIPSVSGGGQEAAVNLATARTLTIGYANFGGDKDRYAVYADFGEGVQGRIPLIEILITDGIESAAYSAASGHLSGIIEAIKAGLSVLDLTKISERQRWFVA